MARPTKTAASPDYRTKICAVAQTLFAERGFGDTTIRKIADHAGVNSGLLYHYFPNKEALYLSLLEAAVSEVVVRVEHIAASADDDPERKIQQIVRLYVSHFQAHPQSFQLVRRAVDENSPAAQALAQRW